METNKIKSLIPDMEPVNLYPLTTERMKRQSVAPVKSMDIFDANKDYHPEGLYSNTIFGLKGTRERITARSYIDLKMPIMNPKYAIELFSLKNMYAGIIEGKVYAVWDEDKKDFVKSNILDGETGYSFFMDKVFDIEFKNENNSPLRKFRIDLFKGNKKMTEEQIRSSIYITTFPVIPAGIRDIEIDEEGMVVEDDINPLYRKLLRIANAVPDNISKAKLKTLDTARARMQMIAIEIFKDYFEPIVSGKRGFAKGKYAARNTSGSTRNVFTAMDPSSKKLGNKDAVTVNHTIVGLKQFLMGNKYKCIFEIKNNAIDHIFDKLPGPIPLLYKDGDGKWMSEWTEVDSKSALTWGTNEGIEKLINKFSKEDIGTDFVMIEGKYPVIIYREGDKCRIVKDLRTIPDDKQVHLRPITWCEFLYLSVYEYAENAIVYTTRYPADGFGSIYPSYTYLKGTVSTDLVKNVDKELRDTGKLAKGFPRKDSKPLLSVKIHPSKIEGLNADYDGDMGSGEFPKSKEAIEEAREYLKSPEAFLSPDGTLYYGIISNTSKLVTHNMLKGLPE